MRTNLPLRRTSLIGRDHDLAAVHELVLHAEGRLMTLTGAGGSGKTSLALEVGRSLLGDFPDGVWLVELAPLADPVLVAPAVAAPFGVQEGPSRSLLAGLLGYLESRRLLLLLDNCEHLVDAVAALAEALLDRCLELRILATSREPLRIAGEQTWRVPSLAVPDPERLPPTEALAAVPAVRLFVERAKAAQPAFALTSSNAAAVGRVVSRLDGIPLALELAATRVRALAVEQLAARLEENFHLLTGGARTAPSRQQTLRATLDWSHALLAETEQVLFRRLAVFAGGWDLEAAEVVCPGEGLEEGDVVDVLTRLVDKSLVVAEEQAGAARYGLLEPIRQYAQEHLRASGDLEAIRLRHAVHFLALAEQAEPHLEGANGRRWMDRLEREHDNLRAALRWTGEQADVEPGLRLSAALAQFWQWRGHFGEGQRWLELALARSRGMALRSRAKTLQAAGMLALNCDNLAHAAAWSEESLALYRALGDATGVRWSLLGLGGTAGGSADYAAARPLLDEALALARASGDTRLVGWVLLHLGAQLVYQADHGEIDYAAARAPLEEALALARQNGNTQQMAGALVFLGYLAREEGDLERATALAVESVHLLRDVGDYLSAPYSLELLAGVAATRAQPERAARLYGAAEAVREVIGVPLADADRLAYDRHLLMVRARLDPAAVASAWAAGRALSLEQAIAEALATAAEIASPSRSPAHPLSEREREVAVLITRGLTDRQIAKQLVIASGTVGQHVVHILDKLGFRSRAQVAAWVVARGLHTAPPGGGPL